MTLVRVCRWNRVVQCSHDSRFDIEWYFIHSDDNTDRLPAKEKESTRIKHVSFILIRAFFQVVKASKPAKLVIVI